MSANVALSETFDQWRVKTNELMIMTQTGGSSNFLKLTNTTNSTSNTTGSIISAGGAGFAKSMVVGENVNVHGNFHANGNITTDGDLTLGSADSDTITINVSKMHKKVLSIPIISKPINDIIPIIKVIKLSIMKSEKWSSEK